MTSIQQKTFRHCPFCGGVLKREKDGFLRWRCRRCSETRYLNPKVGVAMIVEHRGGIILARRAFKPYKGFWTLPSGYVEYEETCEQAAIRESREELGLRVRIRSLQNVYSFRDDPRAHMVLVVYVCRVVSGTLHAGSDVSEVGIFKKRGLPARIAFSGIRKAVAEYWKRPVED